MKLTIDPDNYISLLENAIQDIKGGKTSAKTQEILRRGWLEESVDKPVKEEVGGADFSREVFNRSVREQMDEYSKEKGGAIPHDSLCNETVIKKRLIYLKALKKARK